MTEMFRTQAPPRLSPVGAGVSVTMHLMVAAGAVWLMQAASALPRTASPPARSFIVLPKTIPVELLALAKPLRIPRGRLAKLRLPEPTVAIPVVPPPEREETRAIEPPKPPTRSEPEPQRATVEPKPQPVLVGVFASAETVAQPSATPREIRLAGLDLETARAPELKVGAAKVGAFETPAGAADPRPGVDRPAKGVAVGAFGSPSTGAATPSVPSGRVVADAGFGSSQTTGVRAPTSHQKQVRTGDFEVQPAAPAAARKEPAPRLDTPVEVVSKPTPDYTDEARELKVEGEVLLEVQFRADSQVRVLRVIRGLGHGLDESAIRAAERIQFKPASTGGRPIDFQTTVRIVFRLT